MTLNNITEELVDGLLYREWGTTHPKFRLKDATNPKKCMVVFDEFGRHRDFAKLSKLLKLYDPQYEHHKVDDKGYGEHGSAAKGCMINMDSMLLEQMVEHPIPHDKLN